MKNLICIDIGGTAIKYGLIETDGKIVFSDETETQAYKGGKALAKKVKELVRLLLEKDPEAIGIAISTAGVVDCSKGEIIHASNAIPGYRGINYKEALKEFGLDVEAENDVNCAGLAEAENRSDAENVVMLTIGTGIGGCLIQKGQVYHGGCYSACEVGYLPMDGSTFQQLASTTALVKNVAAAKNEPVENWNGRRIFDLADQNDPFCLEAIEYLCETLGKGLASISFILNPDLFILGGGIMARSDVMKDKIEKSFKKHALPLVSEKTKIDYAAHLNAAGMQGARLNFLNLHPVKD